MTVLGFIRHGVTDWNIQGRIQGQTDIPLNEQGRSQAQALSVRISDEQWDIIYSSDLLRATETAKILNTANVKLIIDQRLREVHFGLIEGSTVEERIKKWGSDWRLLDLGKEKVESVLDRTMKIIRDIQLKHSNKRVLIVSHGGTIGIALKHLIPMVNTDVHLHNTSMTILKLNGQNWECELYNCIKHIDLNTTTNNNVNKGS